MLLKHIPSNATRIKHIFVYALLASCTLLVTSCTTPTITNSITATAANNDTPSELMAAATLSKKGTSPEKDLQLLDIAKRLTLINANTQAESVIDGINHSELSDAQFIDYTLNASTIYSRNQSLKKAKLLIADPRLNAVLDQASIEEQQEVYRISATLYQSIGNIGASIQQHIALGTLLSNIDLSQTNNDEIWNKISGLSYSQLIRLSSTESGVTYSGWIDLARTSNQSQGNLNAQNIAVANWRIEHPNHPANAHLPNNLRLLQNLISSSPKHIALLLPLEGKLAKAGESIRDGFLAAYYNNQQSLGITPSIKLYDTSTSNIHNTYNQAVSNGAELIIGPLSKENVRALHQKNTLTTPILALNYIDEKQGNTQTKPAPFNDMPTTDDETLTPQLQQNFYQFGLSLEDEAIQVAERAWAEGHRHALVISSPADWSQRSTHAFTTRWQALGGIISDQATLDSAESYADTIKNTLHIDQSNKRASALKRLFGRNFEFEPRRRQDIDMIFLVTRSQEGTQIKPTLNFYYASNLPVYATSQLYRSTNNQSKNIDLNKIRLTIMPWLIQQDVSEKKTLSENVTVSPGYEKLYALGIDSFLLYSRLQQMSQTPSQQLHGVTGQLSMREGNRIYRQQLWAEVVNGELKELQSLDLTNK
ncbi:MAG: outer membrane PBP1 activator LpoA protein [Candidatus Endobugula sp.]|jgi:outer membrane PBP1 activator LpoA protein